MPISLHAHFQLQFHRNVLLEVSAYICAAVTKSEHTNIWILSSQAAVFNLAEMSQNCPVFNKNAQDPEKCCVTSL